MIKESIIKFYEEQSNSILEHYLKVKEKQKMEDIHLLRVSIKNFRVILAIIEMASSDEFSKKVHSQLVSSLFQSAGKVREVQINLKLMKRINFKKSKKYLAYQKIKQTQSNEHLLFAIRKFKPKKFKKLNKIQLERVKSLSEKTLKESILKYLNKNLESVKKLIGDKNSKIRLHSIRIHLKRIEEVLKILSRANYHKELENLQTEINSVRRKIGLWHDNLKFSTSVRAFVKQTKNKKAVKKVYKRIRKKNLEKEKKIFSKLQDFQFDELLTIN